MAAGLSPIVSGTTVSSAGSPASGARDRGGRAEGERAHSHLRARMQTFPMFALAPPPPSAEAVSGRGEAAVGRRGQPGGATYFWIWNRKSRRLMFLAASSLLHSTESTMGSGT